MNPNALQELRWHYLLKLYEFAKGSPREDVEIKPLESELGYSREEAKTATSYLREKRLISYECRVMCVRITTLGIDEVERIMAQTYAAREFRVLKTLRDSEHKAFNGWVDLDNLESELPDISRHELYTILKDLEERKGLIGSIDQAAWIMPAGLEELDRAERYPSRSTQYFPPQINNYNTVNVQGDNKANIMQSSQGSSQSVSMTNNQPISEILPMLVDLINAIKQANLSDKEDVVRDLEKVHQLALSEDPKSKWSLIQSKLTSVKAAMEIVGFAYNSLPYWPIIWKFFNG